MPGFSHRCCGAITYTASAYVQSMSTRARARFYTKERARSALRATGGPR
jgi:hypothetical protein